MADLSDVTAYLAGVAAAAVYPGGISQPSVAAMDVRIFEGWPTAEKLDRDVAGLNDDGSARANGPASQVSIFPMPGTGNQVFQIQDHTYVLVPVSLGMAVTVVGNVISVAGQPNAGEFLTLVCDGSIVLSRSGASTAALLAAIAADAVAAGYAATSNATSLTVPVVHDLVVRQGGRALMGRVTNRQSQLVMISVWAPNRIARNALAAAIDVLVKATTRVSLPDTSQAIVRYNRTNQSDEMQSVTVYRRDLIYEVEYATLLTFPGFTITTVDVTIASLNGPAQAHAIT